MVAYLVAVGIIALIYMLLTIGLNLQYGYTGLINFGVVAFFAIGAYASALLTLAGWPMLPAFVVAMVAAGTGRLSDRPAVAAPVRRLPGRRHARLLGGRAPGDPAGAVAHATACRACREFRGCSSRWASANMPTSPLSPCWCCATSQPWRLMTHLVRSPYGRLMQAIRDDEVAVEAIGKDPRRYKVQVFMLGAGLAGLAGAFYAHFITYLSPDQFLPLVTFYVWIAMIIGGTGRTAARWPAA